MVALAELVSADTVKKMFVPVLLQMHKDPVANIRINVAKTIQALAAPLKATKENQVRKKLLNFCVGCCASDT
jgi:hypothetical protein